MDGGVDGPVVVMVMFRGGFVMAVVSMKEVVEDAGALASWFRGPVGCVAVMLSGGETAELARVESRRGLRTAWGTENCWMEGEGGC